MELDQDGHNWKYLFNAASSVMRKEENDKKHKAEKRNLDYEK
jgi:hypothetical protein